MILSPFQGITDGAALQSKAKENLMFQVAEIDVETRINMSYSKHESIRQCSFGSKDCDFEE